MDLSELKKIIEGKKAVFGTRETLKLAKKQDIKEILVSSNCPGHITQKFEELKIKTENSEKTNKELGALCKKAFNISVIGVKK